MKFSMNNYKGTYAMHYKTEEEARNFRDYLHAMGKRGPADARTLATRFGRKRRVVPPTRLTKESVALTVS